MSDDKSPQPDPGGLFSIGGPMPWFSVSLSLTADDLDPDEVTRLIGVEPDLTRRKGVRSPAPDGPWMSSNRLSSTPARRGHWSIELCPEAAPGRDVEEAVAEVLERIAAVPTEAWRQASAGTLARVFVAVTLDAYNRGFGFKPDLLRRIADLGLALDFDIYDGL